MELLWQNGQVVMHSQKHRKLSSNQHESSQLQKHDQPIMRGGGSYGNSSNLIQDDEAVSWIHYPVEDSFEKEFCLNFFNELPVPHPMEIDKAVRQVEAEKIVKLGSSDDVLNTSNQQSTIKGTLVPEISGNQMPPPRVQFAKSTQQNNVSGNLGKVVNFSQFTVPVKGDLRPSSLHFGGDARECSVMTVGSSHCGSNQIVNDPDFSRASSNAAGTAGFSAGTFKEDVHKSVVSQSEGRKTETLEPTLTSSSGGSDSSFGGTLKESAGASSHKRKGRDNEESECQSEVTIPLSSFSINFILLNLTLELFRLLNQKLLVERSQQRGRDQPAGAVLPKCITSLKGCGRNSMNIPCLLNQITLQFYWA